MLSPLISASVLVIIHDIGYALIKNSNIGELKRFEYFQLNTRFAYLSVLSEYYLLSSLAVSIISNSVRVAYD